MAEITKTDDMMSLTQTSKRILQMMCQKFKGTDPEIDRKIDAAAPFIMGNALATYVPGLRPGEPTVPPYLEGEAGVGKTSIVEQASRDFCKITGLNFLKNPPVNVIPTKQDFYFFDISLAGETNKSEFGGIPIKGLLSGESVSDSPPKSWLSGLEHDANLLKGLLKVTLVKTQKFADSAVSSTEMTFSGEDPRRVDQIISLLADSVSRSAKEDGINAERVATGGTHQNDRISYSSTKNDDGTTTVKFSEPAEDVRSAVYVAHKLPDARFRKAPYAKFTVALFDEMDKTYKGLRNVFLQIAQQGRVSGLVDLGPNSFVVAAGNTGLHNASESARSVPEASRMEIIKVHVTPTEWADYLMKKYAGDIDGDCHLSSFMERAATGNPHLFHADVSKVRGNAPSLPNPRSWENAESGLAFFFGSSRQSAQSPLVYKEEIRSMLTSRVGSECADAYLAHMVAMETEAIPLAEAFIKTGKLNDSNKKKFEANSGKGNFRSSAEQDFGFRFATAVADSVIIRISKSIEEGKSFEDTKTLISQLSANAFRALAGVEPSMLTYGTARLSSRTSYVDTLGFLDEKSSVRMVRSDVAEAITEGIVVAVKEGLYGDQEQSEATQNTLVKYLTGDSQKVVARKRAP